LDKLNLFGESLMSVRPVLHDLASLLLASLD
jgi:hypothetical protein